MPGQHPETLLFVCRHGAAKSVLAAELARRRAAELGLPLHVEARGVEPDRQYAAELAVAIPGFVPSGEPRQATREDIADASTIVTFDLDPEELPAAAAATRWDGLPPVSEDPLGARQAIESRLERVLGGRSAD